MSSDVTLVIELEFSPDAKSSVLVVPLVSKTLYLQQAVYQIQHNLVHVCKLHQLQSDVVLACRWYTHQMILAF